MRLPLPDHCRGSFSRSFHRYSRCLHSCAPMVVDIFSLTRQLQVRLPHFSHILLARSSLLHVPLSLHQSPSADTLFSLLHGIQPFFFSPLGAFVTAEFPPKDAPFLPPPITSFLGSPIPNLLESLYLFPEIIFFLSPPFRWTYRSLLFCARGRFPLAGCPFFLLVLFFFAALQGIAV